jgi:hypothetical protein
MKKQYTILDICEMSITTDTQTCNSPHIQPLLLVMLSVEDPVPPQSLRPPQILYQ